MKKHPIQFDSGGILLDFTFLVPHNSISTKDITEEMVDELVKDKKEDFEWEFKFFLMSQLGYIGKDENNKWIKNG